MQSSAKSLLPIMTGPDRTQASKEIAQLTLRSIACGRDRDLYRRRLDQLEAEYQNLKNNNEQLLKNLLEQEASSRALQEENKNLREQLKRPQQLSNRQLEISQSKSRDQRLWELLEQTVAHIDPSMNSSLDGGFCNSGAGLVDKLAQELTSAKTEIRDITYKMKHLECDFDAKCKELAVLKTKLRHTRVQQCMAVACAISLKQQVTKQRLFINNYEEAMRRMKTMQEIHATRQGYSGKKPLAVLEGEHVLRGRLFAAKKFLQIFEGDGKRIK